jgi:hypothetical protein
MPEASISKHFDDRRDGVPMFIENQHRDTDEEQELLELRMDGPRILEVSKNCWKLRIEINILVQVVMDDVNFHRIDDLVGLAQSAFTDIPVFRYGNTPGDDDSFLGCLRLLQNRSNVDYLEANRFGQVDTRTKLLQSTVEGHFEMDLQT